MMAGRRSSLSRRPAQYRFGQETLAHIGADGAQQAALAPTPRGGKGRVDEPQHIFPGHVGAQAADLRHPVLRRLVQPLQIAIGPRQLQLAQHHRVAGPQPPIAAKPALHAGTGQPGPGPLADQRAFKPGRRTQNLQRELALRAGRVDRILQGPEEGALRLQLFDPRRWDRDRASRSIRTTTSVSPLPIHSSTGASNGRARLPPEACSS